MTFDLDTWRAGSPRLYLGQVQKSGSEIKFRSHRMKMYIFLASDARYELTYFIEACYDMTSLVVCQVLCI